MRKLKREYNCIIKKLHAEQGKKIMRVKLVKIQDDIEKRKKRMRKKAKEKINKAQAKIDELEG